MEGGFRGWWMGKGWELRPNGTYLPPRTQHSWKQREQKGWGGGGCGVNGRAAAEKGGGELQQLLVQELGGGG